ncbi:MAG: protein translocase subunit SecD [Candidatus Pacebacteria bacterium]|nr:protein translocase subunit SecD [Candidatus Paceibacterota bacterium]
MSTSNQSTETFLRWFRALVVVIIIGSVGSFVYQNATSPEAEHPFKLGLDLAGGSHLVYEADVTELDPTEVPQLMNVLRDVIERRVNAFGVSEPVVQVERSSFVAERQSERLVIELPGVTDVGQAVAEIGKTPLLEFKLYSEDLAKEQDSLRSLDSLSTATSSAASGTTQAVEGGTTSELPFADTGLTGRYLKTANMEFAGGQTGQVANEPLVSVSFNDEGAKLFADITRAHVGEQLGIFLDGELLSAPTINEAIVGGTAIISGDFTMEEARSLAENLSFGALPMPIELVSTQTIDATLGAGVIDQSIKAGLIGFALIAMFMIFWYRVPGIVASLALISYVLLSLAIFQLIPVTLTAAGLAGLVLSIGIAVDANVLVFERLKEELREGKGSHEAIQEGFRRAWLAIRDSNLTGLISAVILFWFGTAMIKGFALVLAVGIIISMISAITITRTLLMTLPDVKREDEGVWPYLLGTGLRKK